MTFASLKEKRGQKSSLPSAPSLSAPARSCELGVEEGGFALRLAGARSSLTLRGGFAGPGPGLAVPAGRRQAAPRDAVLAASLKPQFQKRGEGESVTSEKSKM